MVKNEKEQTGLNGKWTFACLNRLQWNYEPYGTKEEAIEAAKQILCVGCLVGQITRPTDLDLQYSITHQERILFPFTGWANSQEVVIETVEKVEKKEPEVPVKTKQLNMFNFDW